MVEWYQLEGTHVTIDTSQCLESSNQLNNISIQHLLQNILINHNPCFVFSGSPFVFKVTSKPDASKVRVHGPGVEHGILATYLSKFHVETRGAGAGQLTVRIRGPKG